jgi:hypothetical protein
MVVEPSERTMVNSDHRRFDLAKVNEVWEEYARTHDLNGQDHMVVGIDPDTREVFLGPSLRDVIERLTREGNFRPLYYRRVGSPYLYRKGGRR